MPMRNVNTRVVLAMAALAVGLYLPAAGHAEDEPDSDGQTQMQRNQPGTSGTPGSGMMGQQGQGMMKGQGMMRGQGMMQGQPMMRGQGMMQGQPMMRGQGMMQGQPMMRGQGMMQGPGSAYCPCPYAGTPQAGMGRMGGGQGMMMGPQGQGMMGGQGMMTGPKQGRMGMQGRGRMPAMELDVDQVRAMMEQRVAMTGNPRLEVGTVRETDAGIIVADVVTKDEGALVNRFAVNPRTGENWPIM